EKGGANGEAEKGALNWKLKAPPTVSLKSGALTGKLKGGANGKLKGAPTGKLKGSRQLKWFESLTGSRGYILITVMQAVYPFIAMVSYNVIIGDTLTKNHRTRWRRLHAGQHNTYLCFHSPSTPQPGGAGRWSSTGRGLRNAGLLALGLIGFASFATGVQGDILENYCPRDDLINVSRLLFAPLCVMRLQNEPFLNRMPNLPMLATAAFGIVVAVSGLIVVAMELAEGVRCSEAPRCPSCWGNSTRLGQ
uniref:Aa_trans domain-containing protein n=1 Tax=Macrostomum lignano TaxID=282301 RepID=A0A1I8F8M6_9PLAT